MTEKQKDETKLCQKHQKPLVIYCDDQSCKCLLCMECMNEGNHVNHKTYGMGLIKKMQISSSIATRAERLNDLIEKLKMSEKELKSCKETWQNCQEDIEKIEATTIGKCILSRSGKSKIQLAELIEKVSKTINDHSEEIQQLVQTAEKDCSSLNIRLLLEQNKSVDEKILEKAVDQIGSSVMAEGNRLLEEISSSNYSEQLENFKDILAGQSSNVAGKRKKQEKVQAEKEEEKKPKVSKKQKEEKKKKKVLKEEESEKTP